MNGELSRRQLADGEQMCAETSRVQVRREQTRKESRLHMRLGENLHFLFRCGRQAKKKILFVAG